MRPKNGRWFPPAAFTLIFEQRGLAWDGKLLEEALRVGARYLDAVHTTPVADEAAERAVWLRYHEVVLEHLSLPVDRGELAEAITESWTASPDVEPYPSAIPTLAELRRRDIPVVVLSDAWPSLRRWYTELGLADFVAGMVISAEEGVTKPHPRVFAKARSLLPNDVSDVVFVDDDPGHVRAAITLGMRGVRLRHPGAEPDPAVEEIRDLRQLPGLLP